MRVPGAGKAELVFTGEDGKEIRQTVFEFKERIKETVPEDIVSLLYIYERSLYAKDIPDDYTVSEAEELSKKCSSYVISQVFNRDHTGKP